MSGNPHLKKHLKAARSFLRQEKYGNALAHLVMLANVDPASKTHFKEEFITALRRWTEILERYGEFEKVMICYEQALKIYPDSETVLNNMGASLFKLGCHDEAASCFRRALILNPSCTQARESLESVSNVLVERWHFRMLNDKQRNEAYKLAISKAVSEGYDTVLDIGSGTGILSMFAVQAGAKNVYACEMSKTMYEMSLDVLTANQMKDSVNVIHKKSTDLEVGVDLPTRVLLVVTETLDCGLLGEGIIPTVEHAWEHLLQPSKPEENATTTPQGAHHNQLLHRRPGKVIPAKVCVYATVISSESIRSRIRIKKDEIAGVDVSSVYVVGGDKTSFAEGPSESHVSLLEPYTTECLSSIAGGYRSLTDIFVVNEYDFNNPMSLEEQPLVSFEIPVLHTGSVDAIAVWFDLYLDEEICLNTGPGGGSTCWEQAVYPVYSHHLEPKPSSLKCLQGQIPVEAGDVLTIVGEFTKKCLVLKCTGVNKSQVNPSYQCHLTSEDSCKHIKSVEIPEAENFLNVSKISNYAHDDKEQAHTSAYKFLSETASCQEEHAITQKEDSPIDQVGLNPVSEQKQGCDVKCHKQSNDKKAIADSLGLVEHVSAFGGLSLNSSRTDETTTAVVNWPLMVIPPSYMRRLNDDLFYDTFLEAVTRAINKIHAMANQSKEPMLPSSLTCLDVNHYSSLNKQHRAVSGLPQPRCHTGNTCQVLDITHGPSVIGQIAANAKAGHVYMSSPDTSFAKCFKSLPVASSSSVSVIDYGPCQLEDLAADGKTWDILVGDIVEPSGVLRQQVIEDVVLAKG